MKDKILNLIHELIIENGQYNYLYCSESTDKLDDIDFYWSFINTNNDEQLKETVKIMLDMLFSKVVSKYSNHDDTVKDLSKDIFFVETIKGNKVYSNKFLNFNCRLTDENVRFADLENYIDNMEISEVNNRVGIKLSFPIYKINENILILS